MDGSREDRMHNEEASGSDDDMEEDPLAEAIIAAEVDPDVRNELRAAVNPAAKREADIMAEVARRRAQQGADETKRKSDEIFEHFDQDKDGYLNFPELRALGLATGGELAAPTVNPANIKLACQVAASEGHDLHFIDVAEAFLNKCW